MFWKKSPLAKLFTLAFMIAWAPHSDCRAAVAVKTAPMRGPVVNAPLLVPSLTSNSLSILNSPALSGGISVSGLPTLTAVQPAAQFAAQAAAVSPSAALATPAQASASAALPARAVASVNAAAAPARTAAPVAASVEKAREPGEKVSVAASAREFAAGLQSAGRTGAGINQAAGRSAVFFDGGARKDGSAVNGSARDGETYQPSFGGDRLLPPGSGAGRENGEPAGPLNDLVFRALKDGSDVRTHLPRTLVLEDAFADGISGEDAARLQILLENGVRLVILSDRPERGAGSVEEKLLAGLKSDLDTPITVVSHGGARVSFVKTGAAGAQWTAVSEAGAFEAREYERFRAAAERARSALKIKGAFAEESSAYSFALSLPATVGAASVEAKRREVMRKFNASMNSAGLPYRMRADKDNPRRMTVNSISQELALGRLASALDARFGPAKDGGETMLIAGDELLKAAGEGAPAFLRGASLGKAENGAALSGQLGALTGKANLPVEEASLSDLRQHLDFWLPRSAYTEKAPKRGKGGPQGQWGLFTWKILHGLLTDFYIDTSRSGNKYYNLTKFLESLEARWNAKSNDAAFERHRSGGAGRTASDEYLRHAKTYAANFWQREIGDFRLAQNEIRENLMTEGKVFTHVPLRSPFTGKRYSLGVSIDRVMSLDSARGRELTATVYRFGKDEATEGDEAQARAVALAVLRGYGRKGLDLRWHQQSVTGPRIARISVQIEYLKRHRVFDFSPEELLEIEGDGTITQGAETLRLTADVERAQNDSAFQRSLDKKKASAPQSPIWEGSEWSQKGEAVRRLFAQYWPSMPEAKRLRAFPTEAAALRLRSNEEASVDVMTEVIRWPAAQNAGPVSAEGAEIEEVAAAPRVVFVEDVFDGPVSDEAAAILQKLVDQGSHLVFMTARPHTGPDSADEILLSRMKVGRTNPILVVSHNGGRIALHSRADDPKAFIEDSRSFSEAALAQFARTAETLAAEFGWASASEGDEEAAETVFTYTVTTPKSATQAQRDEFVKKFNAALSRAGLEYTIQAHPKDARKLWVRSMPLRMSLDRVFKALDTRFKGEDLLSEPEKFLVLGDSKGSLKLSKAWPKGVIFRSAKTDEQLKNQIEIVLGDRSKKPVGVKLGEIRQWDDYWEPMLLRKSGVYAEGNQTQDSWDSDRGYHGPLAMFTGSLFYKLMPEIMEKIWRGQDRQTTLAQGQERLRQMWREPVKSGVFVSKKQAALMKDAGWKERSRGYLERAVAIFTEIYGRIFSDYSRAASDIMHNMAGLTTDRQSLITLPFKVGNKLYKVFTRLPRLMKHDTPDGRVLSVHAYRTGKMPFESDGDSVYAKTLAMSMLVGFAQPGPDGVWRDGWAEGPAITKLHVRFEYKNGGVDLFFEPSDFFKILPNGKIRQGRIVQEIANTIERMRSDEEFQAHYKAEVEEATAEELKKPKKAKTEKGDRK